MYPSPSDPAVSDEYRQWLEQDKFAIDLKQDEYLRRLRKAVLDIPWGVDLWREDTKADRSLPEYLESLAQLDRALVDDARTVWANDENVTRSFLDYINRYKLVAGYGEKDQTIPFWKRYGDKADYPAFYRSIQTTGIKSFAAALPVIQEWEDGGAKTDLVHYLKRHKPQTRRGRWF